MSPQIDEINKNVTSILQKEFENSKNYVPDAKDWLSSYWSGFMGPHQKARIRNTGAARISSCLPHTSPGSQQRLTWLHALGQQQMGARHCGRARGFPY